MISYIVPLSKKGIINNIFFHIRVMQKNVKVNDEYVCINYQMSRLAMIIIDNIPKIDKTIVRRA